MSHSACSRERRIYVPLLNFNKASQCARSRSHILVSHEMVSQDVGHSRNNKIKFGKKIKTFHKKEIKLLLNYNTNNQTYHKIFLLYKYEVKKIDMRGGGG